MSDPQIIDDIDDEFVDVDFTKDERFVFGEEMIVRLFFDFQNSEKS